MRLQALCFRLCAYTCRKEYYIYSKECFAFALSKETYVSSKKPYIYSQIRSWVMVGVGGSGGIVGAVEGAWVAFVRGGQCPSLLVCCCLSFSSVGMLYVRMCVCVRERDREKMCVCVSHINTHSLCVKERENKRERECVYLHIW